MQLEKRHELIPINWNSPDLPTMPIVAQKLIALLCEEERDTNELCTLIAQDPALTAKLLQVANSALYSLSTEVTSIKHAVVLLGQDEVIQLAISALLAKRFLTVAPELKEYATKLWKHLLTTAYIAKDFDSDINEPDLYTLGILHDIGWLVLMSQAPSIFLSIVQEKAKPIDKIQEDWGVDHEYWGAKLLEKWGLPEPFQVAAFRHHHPLRDPGAPKYLLIITLADFLAKKMGNCLFDYDIDVTSDDFIGVLDSLNLDLDAFEEMINWSIGEKEKIEEQFHMLSS